MQLPLFTIATAPQYHAPRNTAGYCARQTSSASAPSPSRVSPALRKSKYFARLETAHRIIVNILLEYLQVGIPDGALHLAAMDTDGIQWETAIEARAVCPRMHVEICEVTTGGPCCPVVTSWNRLFQATASCQPAGRLCCGA